MADLLKDILGCKLFNLLDIWEDHLSDDTCFKYEKADPANPNALTVTAITANEAMISRITVVGAKPVQPYLDYIAEWSRKAAEELSANGIAPENWKITRQDVNEFA
ncbi:hypothetical protein SJAG_01091 [Schizosaccharomyces japonicus yFS275]|nr:hypothetical protein SJAG_01091 [Schizosaccharomyces japonicus yFS275]EEB06065.1 hypothetical protein SJAG_01091 [Schizosaccharomyces japonicus yFS275]